MKFHCCDPRRLEVLKAGGSANAIEFLEVLDRAAPPGVARQRTLFVRLLHPVGPPFTLSADNVRIAGGERIARVPVLWVAPADALPAGEPAALVATVDDLARTLVVRTASEGDFSRYTLSLVGTAGSEMPPAGFDPRLAGIAFSFKVECASDFDCAEQRLCPPEAAARPEIDYLAKDYPGFRRLMLDRLSLLAPGWTERSAADVGITLVELLAYAADQLSYRQDVIANEAYLATARQRRSVRRHARLVDYQLHEGCNARAWVQVQVSAGIALSLAAGTPLYTAARDAPPAFTVDSRAQRAARSQPVEVFETAHALTLHAALNELDFYTWGDLGCCLPRGATGATLRGHPPLAVGQVLVFEELRSPTTFQIADADRTRRWAVRLTQVMPTVDPSGRLFDAPPVDAALEITAIAWDRSDALPFALCLGVEQRPGERYSVARGNIVLADHGESRRNERLPNVPSGVRRYAPAQSPADRCRQPESAELPLRYAPTLAQAPLTHGFELAQLLAVNTPEDAAFWPASQLLALDPRAAMPRIVLDSLLGSVPGRWLPRRDLLASDRGASEFVVELEHDGRATLRFGDDRHGKRPDAGSKFSAHYRVGNGVAGNVGAEAIAHLVVDDTLYANPLEVPDPSRIVAVRNPLPAAGGVEPEDVEAARRDAPEAFRVQERAVTPADYAAAAERRGDVQRAAASFRWTGSWHTVFVTADRLGGAEVDARFEAQLRRHLERFRMAGYNLEVDGPRYVPLDVALHVCVQPGYLKSEVLAAVRRALDDGLHGDGTRGAFHPDNFSFAEPVYLSRIVAAAQAVEGVASVRADRFQRLVGASATSIDEGLIRIGRLEIAQLANNPNFRERGRLTLTAGGGR